VPFVLPPSVLEADQLALVLAYGRLSVLEACSVFMGEVERAEAPTERISVLQIDHPSPEKLKTLAGTHKCAPLMAKVGSPVSDMGSFAELLAEHLEPKPSIALSAYEVNADQYEDLVRSILDALKAEGVKKVRLLRPKGGELLAERIVPRGAVDIIAFPYHQEFGLGPTTWVPNSALFREHGTERPVRRSDISLSPRLARLLLNLSGAVSGQTILDPFCGAGTILMEACSMSLRSLGLDSSSARVQDARENLRWLGGGGNGRYDVRKGDARDLHRLLRGSEVDAIVTEPLLLPKLEARPRTSTARPMVAEAGEIYSAALASMAGSLRPGGRIVIVVPVIPTIEGDELTISLEGRKLGLRFFQPGPVGFEYPLRLSFETTRWVKRAVYVFESPS
jgi:SAM-dependent methyltransferase